MVRIVYAFGLLFVRLCVCVRERLSLPRSVMHSVIYSHPVAPHSSTLAWKIPWTEEPGRLQSMGSLRVGHD